MRKFALVAVFLCGCAMSALAQTQAKTTPADPVVPVPADYVIGPADMLRVDVWKESGMSAIVPVRPDGKISLPLLDDVQAATLTPMELAANITERLKKFLTDPRVTVVVTEVNSRRVFIIGQVNRPGAFPLLPEMTVLQALSNAGGLSEFANSKRIYVLRTEGGKQSRLPVDYKAMLKGEKVAQNLVLKPGDTIVVP